MATPPPHASLAWEGGADGYKFFHLDGFFQAVRPDGEVACTCPHRSGTVQWPRGGSKCQHATTLRAVAALGCPEGFGRDFTGSGDE